MKRTVYISFFKYSTLFTVIVTEVLYGAPDSTQSQLNRLESASVVTQFSSGYMMSTPIQVSFT